MRAYGCSVPVMVTVIFSPASLRTAMVLRDSLVARRGPLLKGTCDEKVEEHMEDAAKDPVDTLEVWHPIGIT